jgi:hypothetical protein
MLRFETYDIHHFLDWFADLKDRVDAAEIVGSQLLQVEKVLNHKCQKALTRIIYVERLCEFALNALQPLFKAVLTKLFCTD